MKNNSLPNYDDDGDDGDDSDTSAADVHLLLLSKIVDRLMMTPPSDHIAPYQQRKRKEKRRPNTATTISKVILPGSGPNNSGGKRRSLMIVRSPLIHSLFDRLEPNWEQKQEHQEQEQLKNSSMDVEESASNDLKSGGSQEYLINIPPEPLPIRIRFNTQTSRLETEQNHIRQPGTVRRYFTLEQPDRLIHTVQKASVRQ